MVSKNNAQAPELPSDLIPTIGQQFKNFDEAYAFYNCYAKHTGFGIKRSQHNNTRRYLRCVREGNYKAAVSETDRQRERPTQKTNCKAFLRLKEREDGTYVVKDFDFCHNHQLLLSPSMAVFMHSHERVDPMLKEYIKDLQFSNVKHSNIMGLLSRLNRGRRNLPCHNKDVLNM